MARVCRVAASVSNIRANIDRGELKGHTAAICQPGALNMLQLAELASCRHHQCQGQLLFMFAVAEL